MKKIILILVLAIQFSISFAQQTKELNKKGPTGIAGSQSTKQYIPPNNSNDQSYKNECYANLAFTVKNYGYNKDGKFYSWGIKVKNNYTKAVQIRYKLIVGNDNTQNGTLTYHIKPGETYSNDFGLVKAIIVNNNSDKYRIEVSEVCFEGQDCNKNGYVDCNGKQKMNYNNEEGNSKKMQDQQQFYDMGAVDVPAKFEGNIFDFISSNLKYPQIAVENNIQGIVIAKFIIEIDGSISNIQIEQSLGHECDEEVIRILNRMPKWKPGINNGKPVRILYKFPVKFKLNE